MRAAHLNLIVADLDESATFYTQYFGFDDVGQHDGMVVMQDATGMDLVLELGSPLTAVFHFGFRLPTAADVARERSTFEADGFEILEENEGGMPSFKVQDPDGYKVEIYAYG